VPDASRDTDGEAVPGARDSAGDIFISGKHHSDKHLMEVPEMQEILDLQMLESDEIVVVEDTDSVIFDGSNVSFFC